MEVRYLAIIIFLWGLQLAWYCFANFEFLFVLDPTTQNINDLNKSWNITVKILAKIYLPQYFCGVSQSLRGVRLVEAFASSGWTAQLDIAWNPRSSTTIESSDMFWQIPMPRLLSLILWSWHNYDKRLEFIKILLVKRKGQNLFYKCTEYYIIRSYLNKMDFKHHNNYHLSRPALTFSYGVKLCFPMLSSIKWLI